MAGQAVYDFTELDNAKISSHHWKIMFISGMGFFTDAYDLFIIGVVMSLLNRLRAEKSDLPGVVLIR